MTPIFSIITCTRNSIATLADTITSVNNQTNKNFEHIFVDGGSTDGTLELILKMSPNAKVLHNINGGISRAMNAGIAEASGEILVHLHSDDFFADEQVLDCVDKVFANQSANWAIGDFEYLVNDVRKSGSRVDPLTLGKLGLGNFIPHPATFIRRSAIDYEQVFDVKLRYCMDYDLWFRLFKRTVPIHIPRVLSVFRAHTGSISTANRRATLLEEFRVRFRYWSVAPSSIPRYLFRFAKRWRRNKLA